MPDLTDAAAVVGLVIPHAWRHAAAYVGGPLAVGGGVGGRLNRPSNPRCESIRYWITAMKIDSERVVYDRRRHDY